MEEEIAEKKQFDETLGGTVSLPYDFHILKYAAARSSEIAAMKYSIENPQQTKLIFQKLPIHMRRRVMSHNAKRMPRRLREAHIRQMSKSGLPPKSKKPSRKYRRRPQNLLQEYRKRKSHKIWLETHIWHAKRFHMTDRWNYKLPHFSNDRSFRASYRAFTKHCLIQDTSYLNLIEIQGSEVSLKVLKNHCDPHKLSFFSRIYTSGLREGNAMFYKKNSYPKNPIGTVTFFWKKKEVEEKKVLWIWVHPSFLKELLQEILESLELVEVEIMETNENCPFPVYENHENNCRMIVYRNHFNRFRLTGPKSLNIVSDFLHTKKEDFWNDKEMFRIQEEILQTLRNIQSPEQLPKNIIIPLKVLDPRFFARSKRFKPVLKDNGFTYREDYTTFLDLVTSNEESPLWDFENRVKFSDCPPTNEINKLRSQNLVPGMNIEKLDHSVIKEVPILLVQVPGTCLNEKPDGFLSGLDLIIPANWGIPFWLALIHRCGKPGGLRDTDSMIFESSSLASIPNLNEPDANGFQAESERKKNESVAKYFRYPPNRRVNFSKIAITSPFSIPWKLLVEEWTGNPDFHVLRSGKIASVLKEIFKSPKNCNFEKVQILKDEQSNVLVPIKVSLVHKGNPSNFGIVCLPVPEDLKKFQEEKNYSGPIEPVHKDMFEKERKRLKKTHRMELKRLRRKRYRLKTIFQKNGQFVKRELRSFFEKNLMLNKDAIEKQRLKMEQLYLPECKKLRKSCSREVIGGLTHGDFSFSEAKGSGLGYIVLEGLIQLLEMKETIVLVRNNSSRQFRFARIQLASFSN